MITFPVMSCRMMCGAALLSMIAASALAQTVVSSFQNWTAATYQEPTGTVCYAFARSAAGSHPDALLTVVHRPQGRDQVALRIGRSLPRNAEVTVTVGTTNLSFYTAEGTAFARNGRAVVAAFRKGRSAVVKSPSGNNRRTTSDTFSLAGFGPAYAAINRECPPETPRRIGSINRRGRA